jgi:hypothetical protein
MGLRGMGDREAISLDVLKKCLPDPREKHVKPARIF